MPSGLGETWLAVVREVYQSGDTVGDEVRELLHVCASFSEGDFDADPLLARFALRENVEQMRKVFFSAEPNKFGHSYQDRIRGPMGRSVLTDVIELLKSEPLTKRATVMLVGEGNGKVPCINAVQFLRRGEGLVTTYFARGQDVFRKFYADGICMFEMARRVASAIGVPVAQVTGIVTSAHIYLYDLAAVEAVLTGAGEMSRAGIASGVVN